MGFCSASPTRSITSGRSARVRTTAGRVSCASGGSPGRITSTTTSG
jgi:hypothetical protein